MTAALHQTFADLTGALCAATAPSSMPVIVGEERVGWIGKCVGSASFPIRAGFEWKWSALGREGFASTRDLAVADLTASLTETLPRHWAENELGRRRDAELAAMPRGLRDLWLAVEAAAVRLEIERQRNVRRPDDLDRAERDHQNAVLAFEAAERGMAEVA